MERCWLLSNACGTGRWGGKMATRRRGSAALARAEAHLSRARGRQNCIQSPPETLPSLLDDRPFLRHLESSLSSPSRDASPRSLIRSLDELFSEAAGAESDASTTNDFRMNVLSLDDLAPAVASEREELKEIPLQVAAEEDAGALSSKQVPAPIPAAPQGAFHAWKASSGSLESEPDEEPAETDVSEWLSDTSVGPSPSGEGEKLSSPEYSEDFESGPSSASAEATGESSSLGGAGKSWGRRDASLRSSRSGVAPRGRPKPRRRTTPRDAAVQTGFPPSPDQGVRSATEVPVFARAAKGAPPTASYVLSPDVLRAMAASSPAALALDEMLRHHLLLIKDYAEASRRLHAAVVASLDEEKFHYHTLEEAKQYISRHRPPRLTVEQVLQELGQDQAG